MFSFFKKKPAPVAPSPEAAHSSAPPSASVLADSKAPPPFTAPLAERPSAAPAAATAAPLGPEGAAAETPVPPEAWALPGSASAAPPAPAPEGAGAGARAWLRNPFARTPAPLPAQPPTQQRPTAVPGPVAAPATAAPPPALSEPAPAVPQTPAVPEAPQPLAPARKNWMERLRGGLRKTSASIATVFTGTQIDESLYEELEDALLMADTGVKATEHLLSDLRRRVKDTRTTDPAAVKGLLADALTDLLRPLEKPLVVGEFTPTIIMVAGVNGAGKTTSIGKLTHHLAQAGASVLLAAADTFRAAAREQLGVWADRNTVEIVSQEGGDPAAVSYDAVTAGRARGKDVVLIDTAGRLPTQLHLMEELRKIKRTIVKAGKAPGAAGMGEPPHEILLVIDGNTGQNALAQVRSFDDALQLTGLIVTKLDGTAKGGVLAAIAQERPLPVYFIGVGEKLEDLETFSASEFAQALLA